MFVGVSAELGCQGEGGNASCLPAPHSSDYTVGLCGCRMSGLHHCGGGGRWMGGEGEVTDAFPSSSKYGAIRHFDHVKPYQVLSHDQTRLL